MSLRFDIFRQKEIVILDIYISQILQDILLEKGGNDIFEEYGKFNMLSNRKRKKLVRIVVQIMEERHGPQNINKYIMSEYAQTIVNLFPNLADKSGKLGYVCNEMFFYVK